MNRKPYIPALVFLIACYLLYSCGKSTSIPKTAASTTPQDPRPITVDKTDPNGPGGTEFNVTAVIPLTPVSGGYVAQITDNAGDNYFVYFASNFEYELNTCGAFANGTITSITGPNPSTTKWSGPAFGVYTITTLQLNSGTCAIGASQTAATQWENAVGTWNQNYSTAYQNSPSTINQWLNSNPQPQYLSGYLGPDLQSQCNEALGDIGTVLQLAVSFKTVVYSYQNGVPQFAVVSPFWIYKGTSCGI